MRIFLGLLAITILAGVGPARAGVYTDELGKCLIESATPDDRIVLVVWMFSAAANHPDVKHIASVTEEQLDEANKNVAELFVTLLGDSCGQQTANALKYEGQASIGTAFEMFGGIAGRELFASEAVTAATAGFQKHIDAEGLKAKLAQFE